MGNQLRGAGLEEKMRFCLQNVGLEMSSVVSECVKRKKKPQQIGTEAELAAREYRDALTPLPSAAKPDLTKSLLSQCK